MALEWSSTVVGMEEKDRRKGWWVVGVLVARDKKTHGRIIMNRYIHTFIP
jgi:hypothetical protein